MSLFLHPFDYQFSTSFCAIKDHSLFLNLSMHSADRVAAANLKADRSNGVGIIGGLSSDSTIRFARKIADNKDSVVPIILCPGPTLFEYQTDVEGGSVVQKLRQNRILLEKLGVDCIAMPCHVLQSWHAEIEEGCSVPFPHMGECVVKELDEANLRPLLGGKGNAPSIGVLATNVASVASMYKEKLENKGYEVILPDEATMEHIVNPAIEATATRKDLQGAENLLRIALHILLVRAANTIIFASDELRELLPQDDPLWKKCTDPIDALVRLTLKHTQQCKYE